MAYLYNRRFFKVDVGISVETGNILPKIGYGWIWRIFYRKIRIWMDMDLAERGGVEWVSEFCPVKGSRHYHMWQKWIVLCKDAHAVDFLSYYTFSPLAFFHLYFFTVDFLPFRLLVCWLFIIFDFFTIGFSPSLLFYRWLFAVSTFSLLTFYPIRLFHHWLFSIFTFLLLTFCRFDF